ncbi:cytochrome P450 [Lophiotrema nucula]|uniref:Cytochrome P450 n=1 Tax=Lophiotrema nucula TaxID=690887 RepID=A0A6A5YLR0_9PLEO|nr:cytochrome P450 [Lophiotrema nucula]
MTVILSGVISLLLYYLAWIIYCLTLHPLASVPGPFFARISRLWYLYHVYQGDHEIAQRDLHERYCPLIRIAPNEVETNDPEAIPIIYPTQNPLQKTDYYHVFRPSGLDGRLDMFTQTDEEEHAACVTLFKDRLGEFADHGGEFDFGLWLEMYTYDVIVAVVFREQFGFFKERTDYGSYIKSVHTAMPSLSFIGTAPSYVRPFLLGVALFIPKLLKAVLAVDGIRKNAIRATEARMKAKADKRDGHDVLSSLVRIVEEKGAKKNFSHKEVGVEAWVAVMGGADSASILLRSIFYYLMKNQEALRKVQAEVDQAFESGNFQSPVRHRHVSNLPYLSAVVKEALRMFPSFQSPLVRHSPRDGVVLSGTHVPAGYKVGINAGTIQFNKAFFVGPDASSFRPERWLSPSPSQLAAMNKAMLVFGAGTRQCTGQYLALVETYKATAVIMKNFDFELADPDREWKTYNAAFNFRRASLRRCGGESAARKLDGEGGSMYGGNENDHQR